jgi:hypothetical protein
MIEYNGTPEFTKADMVGHVFYHGGGGNAVAPTECLGEQCSFIVSAEIRESVQRLMIKTRPQREYEAARARLDAEMDACRYCKRARAKAEEERGSRDGCKRHLSQRRLIYVTSPISETYWSS